MKTLFSLLTTSGVLAASLVVACGDDASGPGSDPDPIPDAAQPDTSSPVDASDGGAPDAAHDARPPFDAAPPEVVCAVTPCNKSIVAGARAYCATATDGVVRCWGDPGNFGEFVDRAVPNAGSVPIEIAGLGTIVDVGISSYDTCVALADGRVQCFGNSSEAPAPVPNVASAKQLAIGDDRKCAVLASGELWCWGDSYTTGRGEGIVDVGGKKVVAASSQRDSAFALVQDGTLFSWGSEAYSLGRSSAVSPDLTPAPVIGLPPAMQVAASASHVCALTFDGRLFCWGRGGDNGTLGLGYVRHEYFPVEVLFPGPEWPAQIAVAQSHSCARMSDGALTCWSMRNSAGELGFGANEGVYIPTKVTALEKKVVSIALGENSTCAVLEDGSIRCWGDNNSGQLGQGTRDSLRHPNPSPVVFP